MSDEREAQRLPCTLTMAEPVPRASPPEHVDAQGLEQSAPSRIRMNSRERGPIRANANNYACGLPPVTGVLHRRVRDRRFPYAKGDA